jgi:hypothetical protein
MQIQDIFVFVADAIYEYLICPSLYGSDDEDDDNEFDEEDFEDDSDVKNQCECTRTGSFVIISVYD